jgi:hypothetical protein
VAQVPVLVQQGGGIGTPILPVQSMRFQYRIYSKSQLDKWKLGLFCKKHFSMLAGAWLSSEELRQEASLAGERGRVVEERKTLVSFGD